MVVLVTAAPHLQVKKDMKGDACGHAEHLQRKELNSEDQVYTPVTLCTISPSFNAHANMFCFPKLEVKCS